MKEGREAASRRSPDLHRVDVVPTRVQSGRNGVERRRWSSGSSSAALIKNQFICLLTLSRAAPSRRSTSMSPSPGEDLWVYVWD